MVDAVIKLVNSNLSLEFNRVKSFLMTGKIETECV